MAIEFPNQVGINYKVFLQKIAAEALTRDQTTPLNLRLSLLESFMEIPKPALQGAKKTTKKIHEAIDPWVAAPGTLTIVDLSDPFVDESSACALFDICLALFLENSTPGVGKVIALDEAHKFMNETSAANAFTQSLLSCIRLQRHLGARIIVATQEPTISPALLDLCSITFVHRFTSPAWMAALKTHLAAATDSLSGCDGAKNLFSKIVELDVGEAVLFCPSAMLRLSERVGRAAVIEKLGVCWQHVRIRKRITADGGRSVMASK